MARQLPGVTSNCPFLVGRVDPGRDRTVCLADARVVVGYYNFWNKPANMGPARSISRLSPVTLQPTIPKSERLLVWKQ